MRRKQVNCVMDGCDEQTLNESGVCDRCVAIYRAGRQITKLKNKYKVTTDALEHILVPNNLHIWGERLSGIQREQASADARRDIKRLIVRLADGVPDGYVFSSAHRIGGPNQEFTYGGDGYAVLPGKSKIIDDLIEAIGIYVTCEATRAFEEGDNALKRMASGEMGVAEYNDYTARASGRKRDR